MHWLRTENARMCVRRHRQLQAAKTETGDLILGKLGNRMGNEMQENARRLVTAATISEALLRWEL